MDMMLFLLKKVMLGFDQIIPENYDAIAL